MAEKQLRGCSLYSASITGKRLDEAIKLFFNIPENASEEHTFALLYTPKRCYLARVEKDITITVSSAKELSPTNLGEDDMKQVFEARVFNKVSEMRWLNDPEGNHKTAILSELPLVFDGKILQAETEEERREGKRVIGGLDQEYLLWGKKLADGKAPSGWTQFGSPRIGSYYVPVTLKDGEEYARFTAVEYLKTYEDGNVAVVDERLTGIEGYKGD